LNSPKQAVGHRATCPVCKTVFFISKENCPEYFKKPTKPTSECDISVSHFRWAMFISISALVGVAAMLITVFVMKKHYADNNGKKITTNSISEKKNSSKLESVYNNTDEMQSEKILSSAKLQAETQKVTQKDGILGQVSNVELKDKRSIENETGIHLVPDEGQEQKSEKSTATEIIAESELVKKYDPSVCKIETDFGTGTGFLIGNDLVLTNKHVINFWSDLKCYFPGKYSHYIGNIIWLDPEKDMALLRLDKKPASKPIPISETIDIERGDRVLVIGYPATSSISISSSITSGMISNDTIIDGTFFYQTDAAINPGNSGSPVFNNYGQLVGMATLKEIGKDNISYILPVSYIYSNLLILKACPKEELTSNLAKYAYQEDLLQIRVSSLLAISMLAEIEEAWSNAIKFRKDITTEVSYVSRENNDIASACLAKIISMDKSMSYYDSTLSRKTSESLKTSREILKDIFQFIINPEGSYKRFNEYWSVRLSKLARILEDL